MSDLVLVDALKRQFACVHKMLREAVTKCPAGQWQAGRHPFFVPARLAFHIVQATDFHLDAKPDAYNWDRFGINWEESPADKLLSQAQLLDYLGEVEAKMNARLEAVGPAGLVVADYAGFFPTALEHVVYAMRHAQHHTGQINAELKIGGQAPAKWR